MNTITVIGNVVSDPESPTEKLVKFSVADNGNRKGATPLFHDVVVWSGANLNFVREHVKKGSSVIITGCLEDDSYENKSGVKIRRSQIAAYNVGFASMSSGTKREESGHDNRQAPKKESSNGSYGADDSDNSDGFDEDDIPF